MKNKLYFIPIYDNIYHNEGLIISAKNIAEVKEIVIAEFDPKTFDTKEIEYIGRTNKNSGILYKLG